ncbi:hypothetical protein D6B98_22555 [Bradyrhizobium sp. LVM 105]|nr:hypothetical protein D6B98_22555 [Bradyrhizobium sp. LVM 105]
MRAQRSNPESLRGETLDCFVARAPRNDGGDRWAATCARRFMMYFVSLYTSQISFITAGK